jgi:hypothetical protein
MLRGWTAVWTMQMLWLFASLTIAVGVLALVELLVLEYRRRRATKVNADKHCAGISIASANKIHARQCIVRSRLLTLRSSTAGYRIALGAAPAERTSETHLSQR